MWRPLLISAALASIISRSGAYTLPRSPTTSLALTPFNITNPARDSLWQISNLTYPSWPILYEVRLQGPGLRFLPTELLIWGNQFQSSPMINVPELQHFVQEFADNIQLAHPVPGFVGRRMRQYTIDVLTYTRWKIRIEETGLNGRLPTVVALAALNELKRMLGRYGPSLLVFAIWEEGARTLWSTGSLDLSTIAGSPLIRPFLDKNGTFQTA